MRTIDWDDIGGGRIVIVDQTLLPWSLQLLELATVDELVEAVKRLAVRGAPALGAAGVLGVALAARLAPDDPAHVRAEAARIRSARPTAVNLAWGVDRALGRLDKGPAAVLAEARAVLDADVARNETLARRGAAWLRAQADPPLRLLTHCNTGALACVDWGTALGVVRALHEDDAVARVYVDETRPLLQGARLTTWELGRLGVDHRLLVDAAAPSVVARRLVDAVVVGADRVTANGDVVNKIGTYPLALACARTGLPFVVAAPESTLDRATASGADVEIESRDPAEVLSWGGADTAPPGTDALNPAFDVTGADLVTAIVTEDRVIHPAAGERPDAPT